MLTLPPKVPANGALDRSENVLAEAHLSAIVQSSNDAIISKALDGTVLTWNPAATRIFGFSEAEMVGQSIRRVIPADRQAEEDDIIARIARGEQVQSFETIRQRKDGSQFHVSLTVSPILAAGGTVVGASKIARDVTRRHAALTALAEREHRLQMLADNISQLTWVTDPHGTLLWFNKRWYDYTGLSEDQCVGQRGWYPGDVPCRKQPLQMPGFDPQQAVVGTQQLSAQVLMARGATPPGHAQLGGQHDGATVGIGQSGVNQGW